MRIAILGGAGAMGGIFGAYLSRGGAQVHLIDVSLPAIEAIRANGLTLREKDGTSPVFALPITDAPSEVGTVDLIINFVKCYHTEAAVRAAMPMVGADTAVLTIQNGWGNAARIASLVGEERVLVGLTYHSGTLIGPGVVGHTASGMTTIGELSGVTSDRLKRVEAAFTAGGIDVTVSGTIVHEVWKKLSLNTCALPAAALLRAFAHELVDIAPARTLVEMVLGEVVAVANAKGIPLDYAERVEAITSLLAKAGKAKASMLQDVEAGRQTEIEVINGAICAAGRETGIPTPVNDTLVALIQALQTKYLSEARAR